MDIKGTINQDSKKYPNKFALSLLNRYLNTSDEELEETINTLEDLKEKGGIIKLHAPLINPWCYRIVALLLGIQSREFVQIMRSSLSADCIVINPGNTEFEIGQRIKYDLYWKMQDEDDFLAEQGPQAIIHLLKVIDLEEQVKEIESKLETSKYESIKQGLKIRLAVVNAFRNHNALPERLIMHSVPVIRPEERPRTNQEGYFGRYENELDELYSKIVKANEDLEKVQFLPDIAITAKYRDLQRAVDALYVNGLFEDVKNTWTDSHLKSITDFIIDGLKDEEIDSLEAPIWNLGQVEIDDQWINLSTSICNSIATRRIFKGREVENQPDLILREMLSDNPQVEMEMREEIKKQERFCKRCGEKMVVRNGIHGEFWGCSKFPKCKYTENSYRLNR